MWTTKDTRENIATLKILVGGNNNMWIAFITLIHAHRVEGHNERDDLSARGQVYGHRHGVKAPQEP